MIIATLARSPSKPAPSPTPSTSMPEPPTSPQPSPMQGGTNNLPHTNEDPGHTMGIVGLILTFVAPLIGFIVSLIARSKSKKAGHNNTPALIGIIASIMFMILGILSITLIILLGAKGVQTATQDAEAMKDINSQHAALEVYYETNKYYPGSIDSLTGIDNESLTAADGYTYTYTPSPAGCTECTDYVLETRLSTGELYTKDALGPTTPSTTPSTTPLTN